MRRSRRRWSCRAVVVVDDQVIGRGPIRPSRSAVPPRAESLPPSEAALPPKLRLTDASLYCLEPCVMCRGARHDANLPRLRRPRPRFGGVQQIQLAIRTCSITASKSSKASSPSRLSNSCAGSSKAAADPTRKYESSPGQSSRRGVKTSVTTQSSSATAMRHSANHRRCARSTTSSRQCETSALSIGHLFVDVRVLGHRAFLNIQTRDRHLLVCALCARLAPFICWREVVQLYGFMAYSIALILILAAFETSNIFSPPIPLIPRDFSKTAPPRTPDFPDLAW